MIYQCKKIWVLISRLIYLITSKTLWIACSFQHFTEVNVTCWKILCFVSAAAKTFLQNQISGNPECLSPYFSKEIVVPSGKIQIWPYVIYMTLTQVWNSIQSCFLIHKMRITIHICSISLYINKTKNLQHTVLFWGWMLYVKSLKYFMSKLTFYKWYFYYQPKPWVNYIKLYRVTWFISRIIFYMSQ